MSFKDLNNKILDEFTIFYQVRTLPQCNDDFLLDFGSKFIFHKPELFGRFADMYLLIAKHDFPKEKLTSEGYYKLSKNGNIVLAFMLFNNQIKLTDGSDEIDEYHFMDVIKSTNYTKMDIINYMIYGYQDIYLRLTNKDIELFPISVNDNLYFWKRYFEKRMVFDKDDLNKLINYLGINVNYSKLYNYLRTKSTKVI